MTRVDAPPAGAVDKRAQIALLGELALLTLLVAFFPRDLMGSAVLPFTVMALLAPVLVGLAAWTSPKGLWSFPGTYMIAFMLFHFGAVATYAVFRDLPPPYTPQLQWLIHPIGVQAAWAALIGGVTLIIGVHATKLLRGPRGRGFRLLTFAPPGPKLAMIATLFLVGAVAAWGISLVIVGGPNLFFSAYSEYNAVRQELSPWLYLIIGVGFILVACSPAGRWRTTGLAIFGLYVVLALPLGLRGEVLHPALAGAAAWFHYHEPPTVRRTIGLIIVALLLISIVGGVRQIGMRDAGVAQLSSLSLTNAATEMGISLRPTAVVMRLLDQHALEPMHGATYWAPFHRLAGRVLPFVPHQDARYDSRIVHARVDDLRDGGGGMGFSPIAEGWSNWGLGGVILHMLITGVVLGMLDRGFRGPARAIVAGAAFLAISSQVRGAFIFVPAHLIVAVSICLVALAMADCINGHRKMRWPPT